MILRYLYPLLEYFSPKQMGGCNSQENVYGDEYVSLKDAKNACVKDDHCIAVHHEGCHNTRSKRLCKRGLKKPNGVSCIYEKRVVSGMNTLICAIENKCFTNLHMNYFR